MNLDQAIQYRSSCRSYTSDELSDEQIYSIIDAARHAPSPKNRQPWRFVILRKDDKKKFLEKYSNEFDKASCQELYELKLNEFNSVKESYRIMNQADTVILVFNAYPSIEVFGQTDILFDSANIQAIGAAIQNMLLKATELGIGSLWICDIFTCYQQICDDFYNTGQLIAAVAFGYPQKAMGHIGRKSIDQLLITPPQSKKETIIWVGPRESDLDSCGELFQGSVTIFGSNQNNNFSYCVQNNKRIDHNVPECVEDSFWTTNIRILKDRYPNAKILYYNSKFSYNLAEDLKKDVICCNALSILEILDNKATMRSTFLKLIPVVPFEYITYGEGMDLTASFTKVSKFIFQENNSSGGFGTHVVNIQNEDMKRYVGKTFLVSPYYDNSISVNLHVIIGDETVLHFPGSLQIIREIGHKLIYLGADYITFRSLPASIRNMLRNYADVLGAYLQSIGYRGIAGFDFLVTEKDILFLEVNPRFQASTPLLNTALKEYNLPSMQELHIMAFRGTKLPNQSLIDKVTVSYSMLAYIEGIWKKPYFVLNDYIKAKEVEKTFADGFSPQNEIEKNAYLFKFIFKTNCTSISPDFYGSSGITVGENHPHAQ